MASLTLNDHSEGHMCYDMCETFYLGQPDDQFNKDDDQINQYDIQDLDF